MSYSLLGTKWGPPVAGASAEDITWTADLSSGLSYDAGLYDDDDFEDALIEAFETWEDVASIEFDYLPGAGDADIMISMDDLAGSVVGEATVWSVDPAGGTFDTIVNVSILLDSDETWAPFGETDLDFNAVATHEIGHAIGLDHVDDAAQIMNEILLTDELGDGDIEGAQELYGRDKGDAKADGASSEAEDDSDSESDDDGGGGGGGAIALVLGAVTALLAVLFGGGAGAAAVVVAGRKPEDDPDTPDGDDGGLIALLDAAMSDTPDLEEEVHQLRMEEEAAEAEESSLL